MDKDLKSIQEVRDLLKEAKAAQEIYSTFSQDKIDEIVERNIKCESCDVKNLCLEKTKREKKRSLNLKSSLEKSYVEHEKKRETKELERELKKWTRPL